MCTAKCFEVMKSDVDRHPLRHRTMHTQSNGNKRHVLSSGEFSEVHPSHISDKDCKYGAIQTMQDSQTT